MADADRKYGDFSSPDWVDPKPELHLVDGVWKPVLERIPPSSSQHAGGERKPTSLAEKKAREEAEREVEETAAAAEVAEVEAAEAKAAAAEDAAPEETADED